MPTDAKPIMVAVSRKSKLAVRHRITDAANEPPTEGKRSDQNSALNPRRPMKPPQKNMTMQRITSASPV